MSEDTETLMCLDDPRYLAVKDAKGTLDVGTFFPPSIGQLSACQTFAADCLCLPVPKGATMRPKCPSIRRED